LYIPVFWVHGTFAEMIFMGSMNSYMQNYYKQIPTDSLSLFLS